jgi:MFS family permease
MILAYLEREGLLNQKNYLYGVTRSYSNVGSALSAALGAACVVLSDDTRHVFLYSVIPFVIDFLLIASYPAYMNEEDSSGKEKKKKKNSLGNTREEEKTGEEEEEKGKSRPGEAPSSCCLALQRLVAVMAQPLSRKAILASSSGAALFVCLKHFVQAIVLLSFDSSANDSSANTGTAPKLDNDKVVLLAGLYSAFFLLASLSTRLNGWLLKSCCRANEKRALDLSLAAFGVAVLAIAAALSLQSPMIACALFALMYCIHNVRKPIASLLIADLGGSSQRATLLSVDSLLTALFSTILAPVLGLVAHFFSIAAVFFSVAVVVVVLIGIVGGSSDSPPSATDNPDDQTVELREGDAAQV